MNKVMVTLGHNTAKATANRHLSAYSERVNRSVTKLASGTRHRGVIDGSVDISLAAKWSAEERRERATRDNLGNALSYTHTQDAYLAKAGKILDRMSELAIKAMDSTDSTNRESKSYAEVLGDKTWHQAKTDAEARGGRLAIIRDADDYADMLAAISGNRWVGASDAEIEGTFKWLDGTDVTAGVFAGGNDANGDYLLYGTSGGGGWHPNAISTTAPGYVIEYNQRSLYEEEFIQLVQTFSDLASKQFNGRNLFSGDALSVQMDDGTNSLALNGIDLSASEFDEVSTVEADTYITGSSRAQSRLTAIQTAMSKLAEFRATVGANAASIEREMASSAIHADQLSSAKSKVHDANISEESSIMARNQVLVASASSMVAQGDILPQMALKLLG